MNSFAGGGAERQTIHLINQLDKKKFSVGLICLNNVETLKSTVDDNQLFHLESLERKGKLDFRTLKKIHQIILTHKVQIIACVEEYPFLYASLNRIIFRDFSAKIIAIIHHNIHLPSPWVQAQKQLYRVLINRAEKAVFVCHNQAQYFYDIGINKSLSTVIYNGIDPSFFSPDQINPLEKKQLRESFHFSEEDFVVGICARMNPVKRHIDFLKGIALAKESGGSIKGVLMGEGPERENIEAAIRQLDLLDDVVLAGFQQDVRPYIGTCDCMAITSNSEAFSMAALETMALEKPLIMAISGGADEQVKDGETGFLYTIGEVDDLVRHLCWLADNKEKALDMGIKAREALLKNFTLQTMTKSYEALFLESAS
ncbi:MAG: glycosyltransferase family 4 protein [Draconibacterium sp.]